MPIKSRFDGDLPKPNIQPEGAFRVNKDSRKIIRNRKRRIERRLDTQRAWGDKWLCP